MKSVSLAATLVYASGVAAFWRMPCRSQTGVARIDPLVTPGSIADHVHTVSGGGAFGMNTNFSTLTAPGTCTSCGVTQDHSAYWTPNMYFQYSNGTTVAVPQVGGMLAYYLYYLDNVVAFPEGFAMISGNPDLRDFSGPFPDEPLSSWPTVPTDQHWLGQRAIGFNCLHYDKPPEPSLYRHQFPNRTQMDTECTDGLRLELAFPSCGKKGEFDSEDHRSHVAYPSLVKEGNCPDDYPVHYPFLFFETIFDTYRFAGEDGEFLLSTGDPVGASYHGDFIMGWESADFLQQALDQCTSSSGEIADCPLFTQQGAEIYEQCKFDMPEELKDDDVEGPCDGLPVDVPVQRGPEPAKKYKIAGDNGVPTTPLASSSASATAGSASASSSSSQSGLLGGILDGLNGAVKTPGEVQAASVTSAPVSTPGEVQAASVTSAPVSTPSASDATASTTTITQGNKVIELVIEATDVTVTAPATPTAHAGNHKRHLNHHLHHMH